MTYTQVIVCAALMSACGVSHDPMPIPAGVQAIPKPCVYDDTRPVYKQRTLKVGERKLKVRLEACVSDVVAVTILKAYREDTVVDRRTLQTPLRRFSEETIIEIRKLSYFWRSEPGDGYANSQYIVKIHWDYLQFVSVENGAVTLWRDVFIEI